jgi:[acyl-carrier-protein] S-malonyltransferase
VQWVRCIESLVDAGCGVFLELGPGRVLGGLIRQIAPDVETASADTPEKVTAFVRDRG